ncbi:hypothetical protein MMC12_007141 [Toensbergia leucococca]|nr:hypothetical protein [Toensbergia leucococca]
MLQGLSSAIVFTVGYTLLFDVVGMQRIGQAMGYTSIGLSLGLLLGPVIGGVLYEYGGYFHVFLPAFALIIVEIVLRFMIIDEKRIPYRPVLQGSPKSSRPRTGANGQTYGADGTASTRTGGDTSRIDAPPEVPSNSLSHSNQDPETEALLPAADPKIVSSSFSILLCSPRFLVAILGQFLLTGITAGFDGVLPVYIRDVFDLNSIHAAFFFSVLSVPMLLSPISGALTDRYGAKWPATGGFILMIPSLILLRLVVHDTALPIPKLAILLFFIGLAYALAMPPLMTEVSSVVEEIERQSPGIFGPHGAYSQAYGLMNTASSGGSMVGPLYAGFVRERMGWRTMSLSMGISSLIMVMFIVVVTKGHDVHAGSSISPSIESTGNGDD